uniref:Uncharacterized protein n=1 Tax=Octopus bimaculoides TaxID=37653 RepID=A0A0L8GPW9_OCTBM
MIPGINLNGSIPSNFSQHIITLIPLSLYPLIATTLRAQSFQVAKLPRYLIPCFFFFFFLLHCNFSRTE